MFIREGEKSMKSLRFVPILMLALSGVLATTVATSAASPLRHRDGQTYNCTGGNVPPGSYRSIIVTGVCYMPAGTIRVRKNLVVAPGALLDATTPGDGLALTPPGPPAPPLLPAGTPLVPATLDVGGDVFVGNGAVLSLGCSPNISCPEAVTYDHIDGNLTAIGALSVVVHSTRIRGNFSLLGGGGGPAVVDGVGSGACLGSPPFSGIDVPAPAPWSSDPSLVGTPVYSDSEDNSIGGNVTILGLQSCYLGLFRTQIGGSATIAGNTMGDPDAVEVASNLVGRNLICLNDVPAVQWGDSLGAPSIVGRFGIGQCGFNVVLPNPAPEITSGGVPEHISVSAWSLGRYSGTHVVTSNVVTATLATTESGETLVGAINDVTLAGSGLTGSVSEQVLVTVHANGSQSFVAFDTCSSCSFDGQTGSVKIEAYGRTSADGFTKGTFLVISGGTGGGGLATLAGWGTFSSAGEPSSTLRLKEHLSIT